MKKILMLAAAVAMLASCTNDTTTDELLVNGGSQVSTWNGEGLVVEASAEDVTRVNTNVEDGASRLTWEAGDELTLVHGGAKYVYLAQEAGRVSTFVPKDDANAITSVDATLPVAAFYNVGEVDPATLKATFAVAAEQTEGELTNKLPLCGYAATTVVEEGKIVVKMKPLASVVEFELSASSTWNANALSLGVSSRQLNTYASAEGLVVDAATGAIDLSAATLGKTIKVNLAAMHDFATKRNVSVVVPGVSKTATTIVGEGDDAKEATTYIVPVYKGKGCVKLYKNGVENFRRTIWNTYVVDNKVNTVVVDERKHVYQPLKDILDGHKDGISTAEDMKALADEINYSVETYPCGTGFCNEDGVILLNNNISLAQYANWPGIGHNYDGNLDNVEIQFAGHFDGQNNTVKDMKILHNNDCKVEYTKYDGSKAIMPVTDAGLFGAAMFLGSIKNLTVEGEITMDYIEPSTDAAKSFWSYAGGVVGQSFGVQLENLTSYVNIKSGTNLDCKQRVGGITGRISSNGTTAPHAHSRLVNYGTIEAKHAKGARTWEIIAGGLVGNINDGDAVTFTISDCENHGSVTVVSTGVTNSGGCFGFVSRNHEDVESTFSNCVNNGAVCLTCLNAQSIGGGIAGQVRSYAWEDCVNKGNLSIGEDQHEYVITVDDKGKQIFTPTEVYLGGIFGYTNARIDKANSDYPEYTTSKMKSKVYMDSCKNSGTVTIDYSCAAMIGGIIGYATHPLEMDGCKNLKAGKIACQWTDESACCAHVGGVVGKFGVNSCAMANGIKAFSCTNAAEVISNYVNSEKNPIDDGTGWSYLGGCFGSIYGGQSVSGISYTTHGAYIEGCENSGKVRVKNGLKFRAGGVTGLMNATELQACVNSGTCTMELDCNFKEQFLGGVVGYVEAYAESGGKTSVYSNNVIQSCVNEGDVACCVAAKSNTGDKTASENFHICLGGILGRTKDATTNDNFKAAYVKITDCENSGYILSSNGHDGVNVWSTNKWVLGNGTVTTNMNYELRGIIVGATSKPITLTNCTLGGGVGTVKNYNAETGEFEYDVLHELVNDESNTYHYARWANAWTQAITLTNCSFGN